LALAWAAFSGELNFHDQLDMVLGGSLGGRRNPSVIRDLVTAEVVRAG
jgi:L-threonylcarbamoyladenylate synthase